MRGVRSLFRTALGFFALAVAPAARGQIDAGGLLWSPPMTLHSTTIDVGAPELATDGAGKWIVVFNDCKTQHCAAIEEEADILYRCSTDHGVTWSATAPVHANASTDTADDWQPTVAFAGGDWVVAWQRRDLLGGPLGTDQDVVHARATSPCGPWTGPAPLNTNAASDSGEDYGPRIAGDASGRWVAVWNSTDTLGGTIGNDEDLLFARSSDGGASWSAPAPVTLLAAADSDTPPFDCRNCFFFDGDVATDGANNWVVAWNEQAILPTLGADGDVIYARSTNGGASWEAPRALNTDALVDPPINSSDWLVRLEVDGAGTWLAVWERWVGAFAGDVRAARSTNAGVSWEPPRTVVSSLAFIDEWPSLATDGASGWRVGWWGRTTPADPPSIYLSASADGLTWSMPQTLAVDSLTLGSIVTGAGVWIAAWDDGRIDPSSEPSTVTISRSVVPGDSDRDGVLDDGVAGEIPCATGQVSGCDDNCPFVANPGQQDQDGDGRGDACDGPPGGITLTVKRSGQGTIASVPPGIECGTDCSESYDAGTVVTLTAAPSPGFGFVKWSARECPGTGSCTLTLTRAQSVTATFVSQQLSVSKRGSGRVSGAGIDCGADCGEGFAPGTIVSLIATPDPGFGFLGWSGGCTGTGACTVGMTARKTVTATFASFALTVSRKGEGSVTSAPAGITCGVDCSESYPANASVTLTPTPAPGFGFTGWSGGCTGTGACTVGMTARKTVTATFASFALTVSRKGEGSVTSAPAGITCGVDCSESYPANASVTLTPTPAPGFGFAGWSGGCTGTGACTVGMTARKTVTATFASFALTVSRKGTGTVSSDPPGIACGSDCGETYPANQLVTLTAHPETCRDAVTWKGCSGGSSCVVPMTAAKTVTATFTRPASPFDATFTGTLTSTGDRNVAEAVHLSTEIDPDTCGLGGVLYNAETHELGTIDVGTIEGPLTGNRATVEVTTGGDCPARLDGTIEIGSRGAAALDLAGSGCTGRTDFTTRAQGSLGTARCLNLAGRYRVTETILGGFCEVVIDGERDTIPIPPTTGSANIDLAQSACNLVGYDPPDPDDLCDANIARRGALTGNHVAFTGPFLCPIQGVGFQSNLVTIEGKVEDELFFHVVGEGVADARAGADSLHCEAASVGTFKRCFDVAVAVFRGGPVDFPGPDEQLSWNQALDRIADRARGTRVAAQVFDPGFANPFDPGTQIQRAQNWFARLNSGCPSPPAAAILVGHSLGGDAAYRMTYSNVCSRILIDHVDSVLDPNRRDDPARAAPSVRTGGKVLSYLAERPYDVLGVSIWGRLLQTTSATVTQVLLAGTDHATVAEHAAVSTAVDEQVARCLLEAPPQN